MVLDHLRVCGADHLLLRTVWADVGSSPRVRSRPRGQDPAHQHAGIISACAEQTSVTAVTRFMASDHLRVCGADPREQSVTGHEQGSSPRVRSRLGMLLKAEQTPGIISACAEQTCWLASPRRAGGDHLRVCGADFDGFQHRRHGVGSSPRVRSRLRSHHRYRLPAGIISACAEQTPGRPGRTP